MSASIVSRPTDFGSAYVPVEYTFSSSFAGINATHFSVRAHPTDATLSRVTIVVPDPIFIGDLVSITDTPSAEMDGEFTIVAVSLNHTQSQGDIDINTPYLGTETNISVGTVVISSPNIRMISDLYVDGSFVDRKMRFKDINDQFVFDWSEILQVELGNGLEPLTLSSDVKTTVGEAAGLIHVTYAEKRDLDVDGINTPTLVLDTTQTPPDLFSDSANTRLIINGVVPYLEFTLGSTRSEIRNTDSNLDTSFKATTSTTDTRFLTNSPSTIRIGSSESYQLQLAIEPSAETWARKVTAYDSTGATLATTSDTITTSASAVYGFTCGTGDLDSTRLPSTTTSYDVEVTSDSVTRSEVFTFEIDAKCYSSSTRFVWLNPRGGYDAYTFNSQSRLNSKVIKKTFKKDKVFPKVIGDRQLTTSDVESRDRLLTGTHWVTQEVAEWMVELIESPEVFVEYSDNRVPVHLENQSTAIGGTQRGLTRINVKYRHSVDKTGLRGSNG